MDTLKIWLAALFSISIYTFLFGENPLYRFAEHLFIGLTAANLTVQGFHNIATQAWRPLVENGELMWLGVIIGGLMLLSRWFKPIDWMSRAPLGFMTGVAAALSVRRSLESEFYRQIVSTVKLKWNTLDNVIYIIAVLLPMFYLIYTLDEKSRLGSGVKTLGKVGQLLMMVAFGASLGSTIMARISLVIERFQFLIGTWLKIGA